MSLTIDWVVWLNRITSRRGWPLGLWIVVAFTLVLVDWFPARVGAATVALFFLPGWAWLEAWSPRPREGVWRVIMAAGLSLIVTSLGTLYLVYLPGPITERHLLAFSAVLTLPPLLVALRRHNPTLSWPDRRLWLLLVMVMFLAAVMRLPRLGYAEFHEDEVEVTSLAVRAISGEDYAVFLHRKGPVQMLVPLAGWLLTDRITEGWARLPFAMASLFGVLCVALFVYDIAGWWGGLVAGLLLAFNGYFVAFGRMVQYQALIFFLASLAFVCLWRVLEDGKPALLWLATLSLAVSLLAHYDALVYLPVAVYLGWRIWRRWPSVRLALLASSTLAVLVLLSFYLPYLRDPQFEQTRAYLVESRVGTSWLYNNLEKLRRLDGDYSSRFYLPVLWILSLAALVRYRLSTWAWWAMMGGALFAAWTTIRWPTIWQLGDLDFSLIPWLILLLGGWQGLRHRRPGYEAIWLWWAVPLLAYLFLVEDPRTHLYVAYSGWAMVAGLGGATLWPEPGSERGYALGRPLLSAAAVLLVVLVAGYQMIIFLPAESRALTLRTIWGKTLGQAIYGGLPEPGIYFGYPRRAGWKAAGWLMSTERLPDDFRSAGVEFSVPIWYTFGTPRSCYDDPELYMIAQPLEEADENLRERLAAQYVPEATVYSESLSRIGLFVKGANAGTPDRYDLADLEPEFDRAASPDRFIRGAGPAQPLEARFGSVAQLVGYTLSDQQVETGQVLTVYLYWRSLAETDVAYRAFIHLGENPVWGQHDDDPACRLPTSFWRSGQTAVGQFRVVPSPETPPGEHPLVIGLYHPATGERLPILDMSGQPVGDSLILTIIKVVTS
jgi:4-amino-4-deoxy-L-arabinose transferase-like glycosyltransferase